MFREESRPTMQQMEISEEMSEVRHVADEVIYVALGTDFEKDAPTLLWALKHFPGHRAVIVHVHSPSKWIPMMGAKVLESLASEASKRKHRKEEKEKMNALICDYMKICTEREVQVRAFVTFKDNIFKGILHLVNQKGINRLIMGSRSMSKQKQLLSCCQILLVCNGQHISTSKPILNHDNAQTRPVQNQEQLVSTLALETEENLQFVTAPNEWEDEVVEVQDVSENRMRHPRAGNDDNVLLLRLQKEGLQRELDIAKEKARLSLEEKIELEQQLATLQQKIYDQKREIQELRTPRYSIEFTLSDIKKATNNFHASHKIGEGGYGPVYKGILRETPVAIKKLKRGSNQGGCEYQQEVLVLSRIRHPNIVQLIGICSESSSLVYEYLQNGSVEDRLSRRNNTAPLSWKRRIFIIAEQRSALIFLHSNNPCIVHTDVKCHNILLDANHVSRLGDFGTARMIYQERSNETTICRNTTPMGTVGYMDPIFFTTGELTTKSDVYSFGVVMLRLLTGLPALKIAEQVKEALRMGALRQILDASAGDWPIVQTEQLLRLALRCCHIERMSRPDLVSDDWRTLEILKAMAGQE